MNIPEALLLSSGAACAGFVNAVAGGGTLLTFPLLLVCGVPAVVANATSTAALMAGTAGSMYGFRGRLPGALPHLRGLWVPSVAGGLCGSVLLTCTPGARFEALVPVLLGGATLLFLLQAPLRRVLAGGWGGAGGGRCLARAGWVLQFLIALYGGYFGAGIGILMLGVLGVLGVGDVHLANTVKNVLSCVINLVALVWLGAGGWVDWPVAGVMTVGAVAGYFLGAHLSQKVEAHWVRGAVSLAGVSLSGWAVWRYWLNAGALTN